MKSVYRLCQWNWFLFLLQLRYFWGNAFGLECNVTIKATSEQGQISAPEFPLSYPREDSFYTCTYTLVNINTTGAVWLVFDDFHLEDSVDGSSASSTNGRDYLQIDFGDGSVPSVYQAVSRPVPVVSPGNQVVLTLGVQPQSQAAFSGIRTFSAHYYFITEEEKGDLENVFYDTRTVIPVVSSDQGDVAYSIMAPLGYLSGMYSSMEIDIIWYIEAEPDMKILFIIQDFTKADSADTSMLQIMDGLTSEDAPLYVAHTAHGGYSVMSTREYLYVRWKGPTSVGTTFKAQFTYYTEAGDGMQCPADRFQCANDHCILPQLTCNSRDNCGDSSISDEDPEITCLAAPTTPGILPCHPSPCLNGGTCLASGSGFVCQCMSSWEGEFCDIDKSRTTAPVTCDLQCLNDGVCTNNICHCLDGFYGDVCQYRNSSATDFSDLQHTSIMIGAFVGAVCLLSVCWLIAMARKRYTDEPPQGGRLTRIVSVHSPDEQGLRRNTTIMGEQDIPPDYASAIRRNSRRGSLAKFRYRPSIDSMGPLSPPPSYDIVVAGELDENEGIIITIPESAEERNLPDVVNSELPPQTQPPSSPQEQSAQGTDVDDVDSLPKTITRVCHDTIV